MYKSWMIPVGESRGNNYTIMIVPFQKILIQVKTMMNYPILYFLFWNASKSEENDEFKLQYLN